MGTAGADQLRIRPQIPQLRARHQESLLVAGKPEAGVDGPPRPPAPSRGPQVRSEGPLPCPGHDLTMPERQRRVVRYGVLMTTKIQISALFLVRPEVPEVEDHPPSCLPRSCRWTASRRESFPTSTDPSALISCGPS